MGVGALSQGALGGLSGLGPSGMPMASGSGGRGQGMVSLVPDKPPPADDPFSDWPPRNPTPASQASTRAPVGGLGYTGGGSASLDPWGSIQGAHIQQTQHAHPGSMIASSQAIGGGYQPGVTRPVGSLAPPPPTSSSFGANAFPAPRGAPPRPQDPFGSGFASPELHAAGPAMVPTDPFNLL